MNLWEKIFIRFVAACLGLYLATRFISNVQFTGSLEVFLFCALALALATAFIRPLLQKLFFIFRILTLGLFDFIIDIGIIWFLNIFFPELDIIGLKALFFTTLIVVIINFFFPTKK